MSDFLEDNEIFKKYYKLSPYLYIIYEKYKEARDRFLERWTMQKENHLLFDWGEGSAVPDILISFPDSDVIELPPDTASTISRTSSGGSGSVSDTSKECETADGNVKIRTYGSQSRHGHSDVTQ